MDNKEPKPSTFKVRFVGASELLTEMDLLTDKELEPFGIRAADIGHVTECFAVPGYLYEEMGEASASHPCAGSVCMGFQDQLGQRFSVDVIAYYDRNPLMNHAGGEPHWNLEKRYMQDNREIHRSKNFAGHVGADCSEITIQTEFNGNKNIQIVPRDKSKNA